jgi:cell division protein FtsB
VFKEPGQGIPVLQAYSKERRNMRKSLVILFAAALVPILGLTACGGEVEQQVRDQVEQEVQEQVEEGRTQVEQQVQEGQTQVEQQVQEGRTQIEEGIEKQ